MLKKLVVVALILAFAGCKKKPPESAFNGTFKGQFHYVPPGKTLADKVSVPSTVSFSGGNYNSHFNSDRVPAGGSGTFKVQKNNLIDFNDENVWTANFDWGLILDGKYSYEFKGDSLIMTRLEQCPLCMSPTVFQLYQYRLKRTN
jgi:hypothetical protein